MPRRSTPKQQKRDWRWYAMMSLNGLVVLSMVIGTFLIFAPPARPLPSNIEKIVPPTAAPTVLPTATPKAMAFADSPIVIPNTIR
jgi:hypothetical protein